MKIENKDLEVVQQKTAGMKKMLEETVVTNEEELAAISDHIKNVKNLGKFIKAKKEEFTAPAKVIIDRAKEMFDGPIKECANAEEILKSKAQKYLVAKEDARLKAEKKIADDLESGKIKKTETAMKKIEALPEQKKSIRTESSGLQMTKRNVCEILDVSLIPDEYWVVDEVRLKRESLKQYADGGFAIPGTIIKQESSMKSV